MNRVVESADGRTAALVCIYYRVARDDAPAVVARVRDFQRTLAARHPAWTMEVLVRSDASPGAPETAAIGSNGAAAIPESTLMETYRLNAPASSDPGAAVAPIAPALAEISSAASALAPLLRGARHVEVFAPCAW